MKKTLLRCIACLEILVFVSAEEAGRNPIKKFYFNWSQSFVSQPDAFSRQTILALGFVIFHNDRIDIRNQLEFCNGVGKMTHDNLFRPYGFLAAGAGSCGEDLWKPFENPLIGNFEVGTGLDIFAMDNWSFLLEL